MPGLFAESSKNERLCGDKELQTLRSYGANVDYIFLRGVSPEEDLAKIYPLPARGSWRGYQDLF